MKPIKVAADSHLTKPNARREKRVSRESERPIAHILRDERERALFDRLDSLHSSQQIAIWYRLRALF